MRTVDPRPDAPAALRLVDVVPAALRAEAAELAEAITAAAAQLQPLRDRILAFTATCDELEKQLLDGAADVYVDGVSSDDAFGAVASMLTGSAVVGRAVINRRDLYPQRGVGGDGASDDAVVLAFGYGT